MFDRSSLRQGTAIYCSDGEKIGTVSEVGTSHFKCDTGFLGLGKDLYVPFTNVTRCEGNDCYLDMPKDRINQMNWDRQPVGWMS